VEVVTEQEEAERLKENNWFWGAWLAQSEEHVTLDLRVMSSSSALGVEITKKINKLKKIIGSSN